MTAGNNVWVGDGIVFGKGVADAVWQEGAALRQLILNEIRLARERQLRFARGRTGYATILILIACIAINAGVFWIHPDYIGLFIAASLYLHMAYFITLLVPAGGGSFRLPVDEIRKVFSTLAETGILPATDRFTRILLDAFFINSRTLFFGVSLIFSLDILYAVIAGASGMFSQRTLLIILFQVSAFLIFYLLTWRLDPGSARFRHGEGRVRGFLAAGGYPSWLISILLPVSALLVFLAVLTTIILLPGITVQAFVTQSGLDEIGNLFALIGILAASQYFILRFLHGIASAQMAERFSAATIELLQSAGSTATAGPESGEALLGVASALLYARIYRIETKTLFGLFPVYLLNPDFSVVFDSQVMAAITGYFWGTSPGKT